MSVQDMIKKSVLESGMFSQYDIPIRYWLLWQWL